jgi:hypothetical protein
MRSHSESDCGCRQWKQEWLEASGPIPKFVSARGTFRYELRNLRTTSNSMILVPLLNPKFAIAIAARCARASGSRHKPDRAFTRFEAAVA